MKHENISLKDAHKKQKKQEMYVSNVTGTTIIILAETTYSTWLHIAAKIHIGI